MCAFDNPEAASDLCLVILLLFSVGCFQIRVLGTGHKAEIAQRLSVGVQIAS